MPKIQLIHTFTPKPSFLGLNNQEMKYGFLVLFTCSLLLSCQSNSKFTKSEAEISIAVGSCNQSGIQNDLWDDISQLDPNAFVWGGDIVYADTDDMNILRSKYTQQNNVPGYKKLAKKIKILGTWDDHDYGLNDGGVHFKAKRESQKEFLDFLGVPKESPRRSQEGVYSSETFSAGEHSVKLIILDTRYFRSDLVRDSLDKKRRYTPNTYGKGTVLGDIQWAWLEQQLLESTADFNLIISSIQFLSSKHGFESWGNFPHEIDRLEKLLVDTQAKNVIIVSGDRHISEFSKKTIPGLEYPLVDFTSSGLTHYYADFKEEFNPHRVGEVLADKSFGLLEFDFDSNSVQFSMHTHEQAYVRKLSITYPKK